MKTRNNFYKKNHLQLILLFILTGFSSQTFAELDISGAAATTATGGTIAAADGMVWVFAGDSITEANRYSNYIESYFHLRYPQYQMHFRSVGRGGAHLAHMLPPATSQQPHYKNRVYPFTPDIVSIMFGHNDSSYNTVQWTAILNDTIDEIELRSSSDIILLGSHPQLGGGKPYLEGFNQIFIDIAAARGYSAVHTWNALKPIWDIQSFEDLQMEGDNAHPGATGHACIAAAILVGLGEDQLVSAATIDASNATLTESTNATISSISTTANGIIFSRLDSRLPMAFDLASTPAFSFCPDILAMNQYMLTVSSLAPGTYDIYIDGVLSATQVSSSALAAGWNMAQMTVGPIYDQINDVMDAIRAKQGIDPSTLIASSPWSGVEKYLSPSRNNPGTYQDLFDETISLRAEIDVFDIAINSLAQPIQRAFEVRRSGIEPVFLDGFEQ